MKKIKLIKIISSISTLGILGLAVGVNTTSCAEKTGVASIHAFLDTETLVQGDNSSIILHVYEMNVLKWVEPKIEFNHGGKSSHGLVVTKKFQLDKLGTYKIKASGVETGAYNIKVSVDGIKGSSNLTLEVTDPNKITSISIQGLNTVAGTRGIATAQAAVYHAMANGKILANDKVAWSIDDNTPHDGIGITADGYLTLADTVPANTYPIKINCVYNGATVAEKDVDVIINNSPQPVPTSITISGPTSINGYTGEANDNAARFIVHDQNNYWITQNITWSFTSAAPTGITLGATTGVLALNQDVASATFSIQATYQNGSSAPLTSQPFAVAVTIKNLPAPVTYKNADASDWDGVTSASLTYDATPTTNDFNEDCYKYSENSNGFSATNLVIPAVVSADGGSTAYKTFLANNAFQQALLSGSITFSEGTKQIGTDSDSDGIWHRLSNNSITSITLPSSLEKLGANALTTDVNQVEMNNLSLPKNLTKIGSSAFARLITPLIVGHYDSLPTGNDVASDAFSGIYPEMNAQGQNGGRVINIGSVSTADFLNWLLLHGLPTGYFLSVS